MTPGPLPLLETLTIRSLSGRAFSGPQIIELLRLTSNLVECMFTHVNNVRRIDVRAEKLVLPTLRRLMFGRNEVYPDSNDGILKCLSLPALEALSVSFCNLTTDDLFSFLEKSSPPLQELITGRGLASNPFIKLHRCLDLVPTITRFEFWWPTFSIVQDLVVALVDPLSLLPNLRSLAIHNLYEPDISDSFRETFIRALHARRTRLQAVRLVLDGGPPPVDFLDALQELVVDGMEIYIGTEECNSIVA
ncbi:hypothetical protein MVEN_02502000 [Mycena venus]|uniref:F-box domain-containing protein n=1 Tax=Mycena venus TaxID=2733690 RepID=A0A8H6WUG5_9AGAR|nr:hypothetical protein MVEN_02502000 [Mycena venus]